jgi:D-beta-D-heptose 7-phosphate kinase / D-beta-D-heptose 1-phosphate adenosyltransferase
MYQKLLKAVTNMGSPRVLLLGDFMLDVYIYGDATRISPEAPVPVLRVVSREYNCGGAGFVAADIAALGGVPVCVGYIGADEHGRMLSRMLEEKGADVSMLVTVKNRPTITKSRLIGLAQHRHKQQIIRFDDEVADPLDEAMQAELLKAYKAKLGGADVVCLQDYNKGVLTPGLCREVIKLARAAGKKVLIDPWPMNDYSKYEGATLVTPNRREASMAVGFEVETLDAARKAAGALKEKLGLEAAVITLDKEGAWLRSDDVDELVPAVPREVYDVSGAGDMVLASLAMTMAAGIDHITSVQIANLAAGVQVEKFGAATVTVDEVVNEIVRLHRGSEGKIRPIDQIAREMEWHRKQGEKIVFTNGCFDVLHRGHTEYLSFCRTCGDIVVLGLNSDRSVKELKGPDRPINNQHDRAAVLASLECVDYVVVFDEATPLELIKLVRPDVLVKGEDWKDKGVVGREFVESYGGKVTLAKLVAGKSSTSTIAKMKGARDER